MNIASPIGPGSNGPVGVCLRPMLSQSASEEISTGFGNLKTLVVQGHPSDSSQGPP